MSQPLTSLWPHAFCCPTGYFSHFSVSMFWNKWNHNEVLSLRRHDTNRYKFYSHTQFLLNNPTLMSAEINTDGFHKIKMVNTSIFLFHSLATTPLLWPLFCSAFPMGLIYFIMIDLRLFTHCNHFWLHCQKLWRVFEKSYFPDSTPEVLA